MRALEVFDQARDLGGKVGQPAQEADHDSRGRRDAHPPPLPAEPPRIRNRVPVVPEPDQSHEQKGGACAEDAEPERIRHQHPELWRLRERRCRRRS